MTQKEKVKIERKNKLKKFFLKTLHIISYILSIGFITILIISGCQSCQKQSGVSAEGLNIQSDIQDNFENQKAYVFKFDNPTFSATFHDNIRDKFGLPDSLVSPVGQSSDFQFDFVSDSFVYDEVNNLIKPTSFLKFTFTILADRDDSNIRYWTLTDIFFDYQDIIWEPVLSKNNQYSGEYTYTTNNYVFFFSDDDVSNITAFFDFFTYLDKESYSSFIFNKNFNYNAPMMVSNRSPYGNGVSGGTAQGTLYTKLIIDCGWFISNGQLFNSIEFWYQLSDGLSFDFDGTIKQGPQGMWSYWCTYYSNSFTNSMIIVNSRDIVAYMPSSNSYGYYQANSSTWINDNYRYITFLQPLNQTIKNKIEQFNNNNQNSYSGNIYVDGGDVFTLLGTAFNSLADFFGLAILPGISIGVLFFLPLIVGIIVVMFHILKK